MWPKKNCRIITRRSQSFTNAYLTHAIWTVAYSIRRICALFVCKLVHCLTQKNQFQSCYFYTKFAGHIILCNKFNACGLNTHMPMHADRCCTGMWVLKSKYYDIRSHKTYKTLIYNAVHINSHFYINYM